MLYFCAYIENVCLAYRHILHCHIRFVQVLLAATEQFNNKPKQGITFLQERGIISSSSSPEYAEQIASFLVDNPRLSKAMIGEFIGDRKNPAVLAAFVK